MRAAHIENGIVANVIETTDTGPNLVATETGNIGDRYEGGVFIPPQITEPESVRVVPQQVTRYQGRAALLQMGLLDEIDAHYAALPIDTTDEAINLQNRMAKERWAGMLNFERNSEELIAIAALMGMSGAQIDDLFCFAETIK